jgi:signal transduction histidine kinase/signal recognition particle receptor subunit beta
VAQWNQKERTLYAKLVYYGPAMGGKTTNLKSLHRITDPDGQQKVLSVNTSDDRTLFFDLLPFNLGSILGYKVAMKVYTVPGQVKYDVTRRVVLAGADAVVFVADSARGREQENRGSLENLRGNMKANRLDISTVPVLFQFNKQDLPEAATPAEVAAWLGIEPSAGRAAVATNGEGVLETFIAASHRMLERLVAFADTRTRRELDTGELKQQLERAFAPHLARVKASLPKGTAPAPTPNEEPPMVAEGEGLLEQSVDATIRLGGDLAAEKERGSRLEREADSLRRLSESLLAVGARFDPDAIVDGALEVAGKILGAAGITLVREVRPGEPKAERTWRFPQDPLLGFAAGRALVARMMAASGPTVVDDLAGEIGAQDTTRVLDRIRSVAAVPVEAEGRRTLLAYAAAPDRELTEMDVRFLATVAAHLNVGFDKARTHAELQGHRKQLEEIVRTRTAALQKAYQELQSLDHLKDRFLSSLSHEMRTPLTAIVSAATFLHDYEGSPDERAEMVAGILQSGRALDRLIENLFRVVRLEGPGQKLEVTQATVGDLLREALRLAGEPTVSLDLAENVGAGSFDLPRAARAVANLLDNARKFSPPDSPVELRASKTRIKRGEELTDGVAISVLDRGPGVDEHDLERIFAPFEQGGDLLTGKPTGVGLGLHESRTIARLHGGSLRYVGRPGGGAEFRLVLPMAPAQVEGVPEVALA